MSNLVRLDRLSDLGDDLGRGQLQDTLELMAAAMRRQQQLLEQVKEADKVVAPVPIEAFPTAAGQIYTGREGGEIGDVVWRAVQEAPVGTLLCDGSEVSRTTYSDLFGKIGTTYGAGNGSTTFNLPNLQRRSIVGVGGTASKGPANTMGASTSNEHVEEHDHTIAHTHAMGNHTHAFLRGPIAVTGSNEWRVMDTTHSTAATTPNPTKVNADGLEPENTRVIQEMVAADPTGPASTSLSGKSGSGTGHGAYHPSLVMAPYIRYRLGPTDTIQTLPIFWGPVGGQWRLDTTKNFPTTGVDNLHSVVVAGEIPEAVVRIRATGGTEPGTSSENKIIGVVRVPYNFRRWRTKAFRVRTKVELTGASIGGNVVVKISDPISAGNYLAETYSRSFGSSGDTDYEDAVITAEQMGRDWRPGYALRFEVIFEVPKTFTTCSLLVGLLDIGW